MSDRSKLVAGPAELEIGALKLRMRPLNDLDMAELDEWVRARYIANADRAARMESLPREQWRELVGLAMDRAMSMTWTAPPGSGLMATIEGMCRLAWQCCRDVTPGLTYEALRKEMMDPLNLSMFHERFDRHNRVPEETSPGKGRPFRRARSTRSSRGARATRTSRSRE